MILFSVTAFAYIDPSAMTYIIQIIAGVVIAAGAAFGFYWRKIKRAFSKRKGEDAYSADYDLDDDDDDGDDWSSFREDFDFDEDFPKPRKKRKKKNKNKNKTVAK